jgi:3-hydroxyisobutyrate dehydrogenase-like beta-hydroxyacid dehydrogenase
VPILNSCQESRNLTFIGFGEVAETLFESAFGQARFAVSVYIPSGRQFSSATAARLSRCGLTVSTSPDTLSEASYVISAVTPGSAVSVARHASPYLMRGAIYIDMNSVAGQTVAEVAACVEKHGGRCVDAAIMGPVPLLRNHVPIVLSGVAAHELGEVLRPLGLNTSVISDRVGDASSLKMLWSVITKGTIALLAESLIAAHRLGLLEHMRQLLAEEYGRTGSDAMILRMLGSSTGHGSRRVDEMAEAESVLSSIAVPAWATIATRRWILELSRLSPPRDASAVAELVAEISEALSSRGTCDCSRRHDTREPGANPEHSHCGEGGDAVGR